MANHHLINHLIISLISTLLQCSFLTPWSWTYMYTESVHMYTGDFVVYISKLSQLVAVVEHTTMKMNKIVL